MVAKRTEELQEANKLVLEAYEELYTKNELINEQKADLEVSLNHLKEMQVQLVQSEKMASLGVLTAGVAHEINNPLNFIQGGYKGVEIYLKNNGEEHFSKVSPLLKAIGEGINRVSNIVQGLSQFSGSDNVLIEKCKIHPIIDNCLTMLYSNIREKAEVIKNYWDEELFVIGNIGKLHQVILNVLSNSVQAIESKGMIKISTKTEKGSISMIIEDNGCGIKKEDLSKVTDPFFTTKAPGKGAGLGLSVAYKIIKEHHGHLAISSDENKGTSVTISLPSFN
ncbi:MAG: GHKL domain-containing protein [Chloroflexia bacterium]|nr:GHKL domain-containing protein [Chloroflexia bacterium]